MEHGSPVALADPAAPSPSSGASCDGLGPAGGWVATSGNPGLAGGGVAPSGDAGLAGGGVPAEFDALATAARVALVAAEEAGRWDASARQRVLGLLDRVVNAATVARGKVVTAERDAGTWALKGDRDLAGFLGRTSRQGRGAGWAQVGEAAMLSAMPVVADALLDGPLTVRHVQEITRATAASPKLRAELSTTDGQARLVDMASRLDGQEFGRRMRAMSAAADPVGRQREHEAQRAERYLNLTHGPHGTHLKGYLDTVSGYRLGKAIEALNPLPAAGDDRSDAQRRADALVAVAESVLRDPVTTAGSVAPAQVVLTITEETWTALRGSRAGAADVAGKGSTIDVTAALRGVSAVLDEDGNAWPAGEVARVLCECELTRVVIDADDQVMNLGRGVRRFDRRYFKALIASGWRTCAWPGCTMPLRWSQLHHLRWWDRDDGPTDWGNCGPYCAVHHQFVHDNDVRVRRLVDGSYEHRRPDGHLLGISRPHRGGAPARPRHGGAPPGGPPGETSLSAEGTLEDVARVSDERRSGAAVCHR